MTKLGSDAALAVLGPELLALLPTLFSTDVEDSVRGLKAFVRLCFNREPEPSDLYCMLGYNALVPPHVRQGMLSRTLDNDDVLAGLSVPVLITHGEEDRVVLRAAAERHSEMIPHARMSYYPGVGHAPFWEDAERFNRELRDFAGRVRTGWSAAVGTVRELEFKV